MIALSKKHKIFISTSILLNIVLISIVIISVIKMNTMTERTLKTNVIDQLFGLHETIAKQENENWSDLVFVSKQLEDTSLSIAHALNIGETSGTINKDDAEILLKLSMYLMRYSFIYDDSNIPSQTVEEMKLNLIRFNTILAERGFDNEEAFDGWTKQNYIKKLRDIVSEIEKAEGEI